MRLGCYPVYFMSNFTNGFFVFVYGMRGECVFDRKSMGLLSSWLTPLVSPHTFMIETDTTLERMKKTEASQFHQIIACIWPKFNNNGIIRRFYKAS